MASQLQDKKAGIGDIILTSYLTLEKGDSSTCDLPWTGGFMIPLGGLAGGKETGARDGMMGKDQ